MLRFTDNLIAQMSRECNLHCPHCYEGHDPYWRGKRIDHEKFKQVLDTFIYQRCILSDNLNARLNFHFHGGEVLLLDPKEIKKDVLYLEERAKFFPRIEMCLQSNGVNLTEELAEFFAEHNIHFGCSFDGYKNHRMSEEETHKLVDKLRYFHNKFGLGIGILGVLSADNIKYWLDDARTLMDFTRGFGINILCSMNDEEIPTPEDLWKYWAEPCLKSQLNDDNPFSERTINIYITNILNQIMFGYIPLEEKAGCFDRVCGFGSNMTSINPDLKMGTCDKYLYNGPYIKEVEKFTDLNQLDFLGVQQMNRLLKHYDALTKASNEAGCTTCPMKWVCSGECQAYSLSKYGKQRINKNLCEVYMRIYDFISTNWVELATKHGHQMPKGGECDLTCYARDILSRNNLKLSCNDNCEYILVKKETT